MRKNGFTLIELLAVIVILAIIALIATPIILGIINNAREESNERSVELYASAVRNGMAANQLRTGKEVTPGTYNSSELDFVEYDGNVVCTNVEIYEDGSFYLEGCTVNGGKKTYSYGTKQEKIMYINDVCNPLSVATPGAYTAGDKYECDVDPNKKGYDQIFYVLTTVTDPKATSVNLIMDSNISGTVAWVTKDDYKNPEIGGTEADWNVDPSNPGNWNKGPISAMNHLAEATKNWTNTNPQIISTFTDDYDGTHEMARTFNTNARLPYLSELEGTGCSYSGDCPLWIIGSYWTLSVYSSNYSAAIPMISEGYLYGGYVSNDSDFGVRPVINLSI